MTIDADLKRAAHFRRKVKKLTKVMFSS